MFGELLRVMQRIVRNEPSVNTPLPMLVLSQ